jgi:hypothetical protein
MFAASIEQSTSNNRFPHLKHSFFPSQAIDFPITSLMMWCTMCQKVHPTPSVCMTDRTSSDRFVWRTFAIVHKRSSSSTELSTSGKSAHPYLLRFLPNKYPSTPSFYFVYFSLGAGVALERLCEECVFALMR